MNEKERALVKGFINDKETASVIHGLLMKNFLARRGNADVQLLSAQMLAVQLLEDAWTEMLRYKNEQKRDSEQVNPGI